MSDRLHVQPPIWPALAWSSAALIGVAIPAVVILLVSYAPPAEPTATTFNLSILGLILAIGVMGIGMIAGAISGRFLLGVSIAVITGVGLMLLGYALGLSEWPLKLPTCFALTIASISFAARGALFARSASDKGWLVAVAVVAGEAAIVATAAASPDLLPDWLLALLPAQWASIAIEAALTGGGAGFGIGSGLVGFTLFALAGTAAATLLVVRLWPRRLPYSVMFTTWLGCSALVWQAF